MPFKLKNLSAIPLDVPTIAGPRILPAGGTLVAELGALDAEVMRMSPDIQIMDSQEADPEPEKTAETAKKSKGRSK